jgi:hypothetical protein
VLAINSRHPSPRREGYQAPFDFAAQAAEVDHSVPSSDAIERGARLLCLAKLIQIGEVGNNCNPNAKSRPSMRAIFGPHLSQIRIR